MRRRDVVRADEDGFHAELKGARNVRIERISDHDDPVRGRLERRAGEREDARARFPDGDVPIARDQHASEVAFEAESPKGRPLHVDGAVAHQRHGDALGVQPREHAVGPIGRSYILDVGVDGRLRQFLEIGTAALFQAVENASEHDGKRQRTVLAELQTHQLGEPVHVAGLQHQLMPEQRKEALEVACVAAQGTVEIEAHGLYHEPSLSRPASLRALTARYDEAVVPVHPLLEPLNEEQRAAVRHFHGPALVLAGAGSGKTRTVVHRIAYLMQEHRVYPQQILAVTFTNKAAGELKERVLELIGPQARDLWVSTFHSACLRVLRTYGDRIGLASGFGIYDDADQLDLLKELLANINGMGDANPRVFRAIIDRAKSNLWTPHDLEEHGAEVLSSLVGSVPIDVVTEVYRRYQARIERANTVDFNDILGRTVELFDAFPDVLERVQQRAAFVHVDEYQDTNKAQYRLTHQLASASHDLMVVGDPDQSIYAFRGADLRNILDFQRDYADASVYRLELNYRSVGGVLDVANAVIRHNQGRLEKNLRAVKGSGAKVRLYRAADHRAEADFVARTILRLQATDGLGLEDFAVLYRTNAQSRVLEESLRRAGIPTRIVGGVGFYDRREVKDVLSYARAALNAADDVSWRRIINRPKRGIGQTSEDKLAAWSAKKGVPFSVAAREAATVLAGTPAVKRVEGFVELMTDLAREAEELPAGTFLKAVMDQSGTMAALKAEGGFEAQGRMENLEELLNAVAEWQQESGGSIAEFLDEAALLASTDDRAVQAVNGEAIDEAITLMTLHNAKGLEFPVIFLVGFEENLIPHRSATGSLAEIEEERRLLYVGITRAQDALYLVHGEARMSFGRTEMARPSRFLEDIPVEMLQEVDVFGQELQGVAGRGTRLGTWRPPSSMPSVSVGAEGSAGGTATFRGGEKVRHAKFGVGTVVGLSGDGARAEITVVFDTAGAKRLLLKFANLSPT